jgi:hypothetical protein
MDKKVDGIPLGKAVNEALLVLPNAPSKVAGYPDVECPVPAICKNVDAGLHRVFTTPRLRRPWTPAFAGVTSKGGGVIRKGGAAEIKRQHSPRMRRRASRIGGM